jgi:hypothetical protein
LTPQRGQLLQLLLQQGVNIGFALLTAGAGREAQSGALFGDVVG